MLLTGGGPPANDDHDPLNDMVRSIVPSISYVITNNWDSRGIIEKTQIETKAEESLENNDCVVSTSSQVATEEAITEIGEHSSFLNNEEKPQGPLRKKYKRKHTTSVHTVAEIVEEEKDLRIKKIKEAIEQQRELHNIRMEVAEMEKIYWKNKIELLK